MTRYRKAARPRPITSFLAAALALLMLAGALPAAAQQPSARTALPPAPPPSPAGIWVDHTGRGAIEILPCNNQLCGRIVWLKQPLDKQGRPLVDGLNEDRAKRTRPICGLQVIGGLKQTGRGVWDNGWIYDPEKGEQFDLEIRLRSPEVLQITGYLGVKFLSETYQWRRSAQPLEPSCAL